MTWYYWVAAIVSLVTYVGFIKYKPRDWRYLIKGLRLINDLKNCGRTNRIFPVMWRERVHIEASNNSNRPALVFEESVYSYSDVERKSNQFAHWAIRQGVQKGNSVALVMSNRPRFIFFWMGIAKIGGITALINHNLRLEQLVHSIKTSNASIVVFGPERREAIAKVLPELQKMNLRLFCLGEDTMHGDDEQECRDMCELLGDDLHTYLTDPIAKKFTATARGTHFSDPFLYVFTSGTTGMPKASLVNHFRFRIAGAGWGMFFNVSSKDTVYCALPLYHSAAGLIGVGLMVVPGATLVLRRKFSASSFWKDVRKYNVTIVQYIGELCRYVLAVPPSPDDGNNRVRLAVGNGLRPDIWREFQERFQIGQIGEFYGATEGAGGLMNTENQVGSIGFMPPIAELFIPLAIVKFDHDTQLPIRDPATGRCIRTEPGEPGEFLAQIKDIGGSSNFSGYTDKRASEKKIIYNAFREGDRWFRSGDLLKKDKQGFCYFVDRIGDTFRWKGENISTAEVAKVLAGFSRATSEPNVYGVKVPEQDGRAGMVAFASPSDSGVLCVDDIDWDGLAEYVICHLPAYARPLFVRILPRQMQTTSTFKHRKVDLRNEGFDPKTISDFMLFFTGSKYIPLTSNLFAQVVRGEIRL